MGISFAHVDKVEDFHIGPDVGGNVDSPFSPTEVFIWSKSGARVHRLFDMHTEKKLKSSCRGMKY